jgi:hypothetical protein
VIEQKVDVLDGLARRLVVLDAGRVVLEGAPGAVFADPLVGRLGVAIPSRLRFAALAASAGHRLDPGRLRSALVEATS